MAVESEKLTPPPPPPLSTCNAKTTTRKTIGSIAIGLVLGLTGCASSSDKIAAQYVSPLVYQDYTCSQLASELSRVNTRVAEVAGIQDKAASSDAALMGVGLVLFWPSLFFLDGDTGREAELGRLRGELDAIEVSATRRDCTVVQDEIRQNRIRAEAARKKKEEDEKEEKDEF